MEPHGSIPSHATKCKSIQVTRPQLRFRTGGVTVVIQVTEKDIAFMFGLYESYKLNNVDFGHYIIPCNYVDRPFLYLGTRNSL